jgi:uncharacterized protein involved in exopolysaccharide biosynthesis
MLLAAATAAAVLLSSRTYATTASFTPVSVASSSGSLASLAGQFGVSLSGQDPSATPDFYSQLLQTRNILESVAATKFAVAGSTQPQTIEQLYDISGDTPAARLDKVMRLLKSRIIGVSVDHETSIVSIRVTTNWPDVSVELSRRLLALIDDFNVNTRRVEGTAETEFLRQRLDSARIELRRAEDQFQSFVLRNRSFQNDPQLQFEHDRLQREVSLRQDVYVSLTQTYEQTRVAALRNTPSISVVEPPRPAHRPDSRKGALKVMTALFVGFVGVIAFGLVRESSGGSAAERDEGLRELRRAWRETLANPVGLAGHKNKSA